MSLRTKLDRVKIDLEEIKDEVRNMDDIQKIDEVLEKLNDIYLYTEE
jgi:hypothetical protein